MAQISPFQTPPTLSEEQLSLRDQLAEYNTAALELGHRINALSLPCKLPPELLSRIFLTAATFIRESTLSHMLRAASSRWTLSYYKWVHVAHVCQYWRSVALGCSALWAFLAFEARHWDPSEAPYKRCLERAADCPLTVFYHQNFGNACDLCRRSDYVDEVGLGQIEQLLPRIRDLVVIVETDYAMESLWDTLSEPAISLERFQIGLRGEAYSGRVGGVLLHPRFDLPDELFARTTPRLQVLTIASVSFSWSNSLFSPSLHHLEITDSRWMDTEEDMAMFLSMLQTLPYLECLIAKSLPKVPSIQPTTTSLPNLRHLSITSSMSQVACVLSHLRLPTHAAISLSLYSPDESSVLMLNETLSELVKANPFHTASYVAPPGGFMSSEATSFRGWTGPVTDVARLWDPKSEISPRLSLEMEMGTGGSDYLCEIIGKLSFSRLRSLSVAGSTRSNRPWSDMFRSAPNVLLLRATGRAGFLLGTCLTRPGALGALESEGEDGARNGNAGHMHTSALEGAVVMPRLQTIQLVRVRFPPPRRPDDFRYPRACCCEWCEFSDGKWGKRGIDVQDLVKGLKRRRQLGASEIELFEFAKCEHMKLTHLRPLLRTAPLVIFDGLPLPCNL
ncbi:hypothetical protein GSI_00592 [Ganoderma sinense ZZ0214-1]|uniref:Uncharacterized protein n=1 Tax=Ganoderma sinense ZZ0214-1 TaxID=1077348 RepID=A0A2G8ST42_9APHY|nr:hypothetical protein GSI_00592 [Ganoderma sinense ZZ0214-1]